MKVNLVYFKQNGKYYTEGSYESLKQRLYEIHDEVRTLLRIKLLPGLMNGHSNFIVSVDVPAHPHNHPHLIIENDS